MVTKHTYAICFPVSVRPHPAPSHVLTKVHLADIPSQDSIDGPSRDQPDRSTNSHALFT